MPERFAEGLTLPAIPARATLGNCASQEPDKPFSGKFIVRIPAELHRELHNLAAAREVSLNSLVVSLLEEAELDV